MIETFHKTELTLFVADIQNCVALYLSLFILSGITEYKRKTYQ